MGKDQMYNGRVSYERNGKYHSRSLFLIGSFWTEKYSRGKETLHFSY